MTAASQQDLNLSQEERKGETSADCFVFAFIDQHQIAFLRAIFVANIVVTAIVGSISLFATNKAPIMVFHEAYEVNDSMKLIGSFWIAIGVASLMGIFNPLKFSVILIIQILYKGLYLLVEVLPKLISKEKIPIGVSAFFLVWVILLPFIVPWKYLFKK